MGVGDPLEAEYTLFGPIAAGTWHLIGDGIALRDVDVRFEVLLRNESGDHTIVTFDHRFVMPDGAGANRAIAFEADQTGEAVDAQDGDRLVLRMTASNTANGPAFIPNGDGKFAGGRIPSITLP